MNIFINVLLISTFNKSLFMSIRGDVNTKANIIINKI